MFFLPYKSLYFERYATVRVLGPPVVNGGTLKRALNKEANANKKVIINLMVMAKAQIQFYKMKSVLL